MTEAMEDTAQENVSFRAMMEQAFRAAQFLQRQRISLRSKAARVICRMVIQVTERNHWLLEMGMIRWTDLVGVAGFPMVALATLVVIS
jgi:hypothetical protein